MFSWKTGDELLLACDSSMLVFYFIVLLQVYPFDTCKFSCVCLLQRAMSMSTTYWLMIRHTYRIATEIESRKTVCQVGVLKPITSLKGHAQVLTNVKGCTQTFSEKQVVVDHFTSYLFITALYWYYCCF